MSDAPVRPRQSVWEKRACVLRIETTRVHLSAALLYRKVIVFYGVFPVVNLNRDWRRFGLCLGAAVISFGIQSIYFPSADGVLALLVAVAVFAVLSLADGYSTSA